MGQHFRGGMNHHADPIRCQCGQTMEKGYLIRWAGIGDQSQPDRGIVDQTDQEQVQRSDRIRRIDYIKLHTIVVVSLE